MMDKGVNPKKPPKATKYLKLHVMCGACNFHCCSSPSLNTEFTEEEAKRLDVPRILPQEGRCKFLEEHGCVFGEDRPILCQFGPLKVRGGKMIITHWSILNCPYTQDYTLITVDEDGKHHYKRREKISGAKRNNSRETLILPHTIEEEYPTTLETCKNAVVQLYNEDIYHRLLNSLKPPKGLGINA